MTEPLIDRDSLIAAISGVDEPTDMDPIRADRVIDYLRDVLTPEALMQHGDTWGGDRWVNTGNFLHRRIFGEDQ